MKKDKLKTYLLEVLLLAMLFIALFVANKITYIVLALITSVYAIIVHFALKKKKILSIYKKQVIILMIAFAIIYLGVFYLLGIFINNFARQPITFCFKTLIRYIVPLAAIIISSEVMRYSFLSQNGKIRFRKFEFDLSKIITFINMFLIELLIYIGLYDLTNYDDFLTVVGFVSFSAISCNLYYNYISKRYGIVGIVIYRMIISLYVYIIPITPNIYIYFRSFLRMLYPYFMFLVLEHTYSKTDFVIARNQKRKNIIGITITLVVMTLLTMLISCKFKYGILVIGSESMTGTLNVGDAVVYERYEKEPIKEGQIIIFKKNNLKLIHRVVEIRNVNGQTRYYTKGDANESIDAGYITNKDVIGVTQFKIMYIGYPTIWVREIFS